MKKTEIPKDWSQLTTSSQFDPGLESLESSLRPTRPRQKNRTLSQTTNSLFVESLLLQLCSLIEKDSKKQQNMYEALCAKLRQLELIEEPYHHEELSTLREHYRHALSTWFNSQKVHAPLLETSRYGTEFEELQWIASGGFGQVFRARHRLDQVEYAVKKIKVRYKNPSLFLRTLNEVQTLAKLNHINIVQYKAAWLEAQSAVPVIKDADDEDLSDGIVFEPSSEESSESSEGNSLAVRPFQRRMPQPGALLYVCMQLCDKTLRKWLDDRNEAKIDVNFETAMFIVRQAAAGLAYIHDFNVVHHDIKPSNIFINANMHVQLGDFGLACTLQGAGSCPLGAGQRGTGLYAAPEQLRGQCHQKSDLFSLGLVLLELISPFATAMERVAVLTNARHRKLPDDLPEPLQDLLLCLITSRPDRRPDAKDLLEELEQCYHRQVESDKDVTINELKRQLAERDIEIQKLRKSLGLPENKTTEES